MKATTCALAVVACAVSSAMANNDARLIALRFNNAPLSHVAQVYAKLSGKSVTIREGVWATLTLVTEKSLSVDSTLAAVEEALRKQNVAIIRSGPSAIVIDWVDPRLPHPVAPSDIRRSTNSGTVAASTWTNLSDHERSQIREAVRTRAQLSHRTNTSFAPSGSGPLRTNAIATVTTQE